VTSESSTARISEPVDALQLVLDGDSARYVVHQRRTVALRRVLVEVRSADRTPPSFVMSGASGGLISDGMRLETPVRPRRETPDCLPDWPARRFP